MSRKNIKDGKITDVVVGKPSIMSLAIGNVVEIMTPLIVTSYDAETHCMILRKTVDSRYPNHEFWYPAGIKPFECERPRYYFQMPSELALVENKAHLTKKDPSFETTGKVYLINHLTKEQHVRYVQKSFAWGDVEKITSKWENVRIPPFTISGEIMRICNFNQGSVVYLNSTELTYHTGYAYDSSGKNLVVVLIEKEEVWIPSNILIKIVA